jgi:hypothetical protein
MTHVVADFTPLQLNGAIRLYSIASSAVLEGWRVDEQPTNSIHKERLCDGPAL